MKRLLRDKANHNLMESERSQENGGENTTVWILVGHELEGWVVFLEGQNVIKLTKGIH